MKKTTLIRKLMFGSIVVFLVCSVTILVYSYGNGVSGRTLLGTNPGCTCHSSSADNTVQTTLSGPLSINTGQTKNYTFTVNRSSGSTTTGGIDIAVSSGVLGIGTSTGIKLLNGEIVHSSPFSGSTTKTFTFTAPQTAGTVTMAAVGSIGSNPPPWHHATNLMITVTPSTGIKKIEETANNYALKQNFPNPFNPNTLISYSIPKATYVNLIVYDILGQQIATLVNQKLDAGSYQVNFDGTGVASGIYYYKLTTGDFTSIKKMTLIK